MVIINWCDKRDVVMLSTKHTNNNMLPVASKTKHEKQEPEAVIDYNKIKSVIDLSDQVKAHAFWLS